jgi:molybdenum cofactor synthesis domain-containing protein
MPSVEIIAVGNELLIGDVLDTNSHWLCRRLTLLGGVVNRITTVRDDPKVIAVQLRSALERRVDLLIVSGGLGPTADDRTIEAVAEALGLALERNAAALAAVRERYADFARRRFVERGDVTPEREKMGILPEGALPLANPVGAAPGVLLRTGNSVIVCLPGVPAELQAIFETSLPPVLRDALGNGAFVERAASVGCSDESGLAPLLRDVALAHPAAYLKSRPRRFGKDVRILVTVSATAVSRDEAEHIVGSAWNRLVQELTAAGLTLADIPESRGP